MSKSKMPFGYNNDIEKEIVQFLFQQCNNYIETPPKKLVDGIIEDYKNRGETITYEDAEKEVSFSAILEIITCEIQEKWRDYFNSVPHESEEVYVGKLKELCSSEEHKSNTCITSIIDKGLWEKVVQHRKENR